MPRPLHTTAPFIPANNSQQCQEFSERVKRILLDYFAQMSMLKDGRFKMNSGTIGTVGEVVSLAGGVVPLPGLSHVLSAAGAILSFVDTQRIQGLATKLVQGIGDNQAAIEANIDSIAQRLTRQYQSQLEQLEATQGDRQAASPLHKLVDIKARVKDIAGMAQDALLNNKVDVSDAQLVAQFAAARIIEYMESHCDEIAPARFSLVPINPRRAISSLDTLYVALNQNVLHYQLLHPNGQIIEGEIRQADIGYALIEPLDIPDLKQHALSRILDITRLRGHTPPLDTTPAATMRWSINELVAAVQSYHGVAASLKRLDDKAENKVYGKLTVIINQRGQPKPWLITDLFSCPGLCVENPFTLIKAYYHDDAAGRTNTVDYGYRLGTKEEAHYLNYPTLKQTHYSPSLMREHRLTPARSLNQASPDKAIQDKQQQLSHGFLSAPNTLTGKEALFQVVHELNLAYSKVNHTPAVLQQIKGNYFLFLRHAETILSQNPSFAISVYTHMAQLFTALNDTHTAWAFYAKVAGMVEHQGQGEAIKQQQARVVGMLQCEYHHAAQYIDHLCQLLGRSIQQFKALESLKTRLTTPVSVEEDQRRLLETASVWDAHFSHGIETIKAHYMHTPNKPRLGQWLHSGMDDMMALYQTFPDKVLVMGVDLANAYSKIGQTQKVNDLYAALEPILSTRTTIFMTQLKEARRAGNMNVFNETLINLCRPLLLQYQSHQQWEHGRALIYAVLAEASQFVPEQPDISRLIEDSQFTIDEAHAVQHPMTRPATTNISEPLPVETCIQQLKQSAQSSQKEQAWMTLLQETITRQVGYLGEPPCAFSLLYLKPFKSLSTTAIPLRLLLDTSWESLMPMDKMYFDTLLAATIDVIDNVAAQWSINPDNQLIHQGLSIDRCCYQQNERIQWSSTHVHTPKELLSTMVQQWGDARFNADTFVTPVAVYTSDEAKHLLPDYASLFLVQYPSLYITVQFIDTTPSPLTIHDRDVAYALSPTVTKALLNEARNELRPKVAGQAGNHTVQPIWIKPRINAQTPPDYYVKLWPEHPGRSYACVFLAQRLVGGGIVRSVAHLLTHQVPNQPPKRLCAEFVETAKGSSLFDLLSSPKELTSNLTALSRLSAAEFTKHLLLSICFHLEDESPKNIFYDTETQTLTKIDVERAFLSQIKKPKNSAANNTTLTVKSILFCMDNMKDFLDEATIRHFVSLDMLHEIQQWLIDLEKENARHHSIFEPHIATLYQPYIKNWGRKIPNIDSSLIGVVFPDSLLPDLLERLLVMQNELQLSLKHGERLTGFDLLRCVAANVYSYYTQLFIGARWPCQANEHKNKHALDRFNYVTQGLYRGNTLLSLKTSVEIEGEYSEEEIRAVLRGGNDSPTAARQSLRQYKNITEEAALAELKKGSPFLFRWLRQDNQARVLQQLIDRPNATALTPDAQRAMLNVLATFPLRSLTLSPFATILDDAMLQRLIQDTGHHVLNLNLANCHRLTQDGLYLIAEYCPNVQVLDLSATNIEAVEDKSGLIGAKQVAFPHCTQLMLKGCGLLKKINAPQATQFPKLRHLDLTGCAALQTIEINTTSMHEIVGVDTCSSLMGRQALQQYPWLIGLSLATGLTEADYQQTAQAISDALSKQPRLQRVSQKVRGEALEYFNQLYRNMNQSISGSLSNLKASRLPFIRYSPDADIILLSKIAKTRVSDPLFLSLLASLRKESPETRAVAAASLSKLGGANNPEVIQALLQGRMDKEENMRKASADTLGRLGRTNNPEVIQALLQGMKEDVWTSTPCVEALGELGPTNNPEVIRALLQGMKNEDAHQFMILASTEALGKVVGKVDGTNNPEVIQALLQGMEHSNRRVREVSVKALSKLGGTNNPEVIRALLQGMKDKEENMRTASAKTLGRLGGTNNPEVIQALLQGMKDDVWASTACAQALGELGPTNNPEVIRALLQGMKNEDAHQFMILASTEALGKVVGKVDGTNNPEVIQALLQGMEHSNRRVREVSVKALSKLGGININNPKVIQALLQGVNIGTHEVYIQALIEIGVTNRPEVIQSLLHRMEYDELSCDRRVVGIAMGRLARTNNPEVLSALLQGMSEGLNMREATAIALGNVGVTNNSEVIHALLQGMKDKSWSVRIESARALHNIGVTNHPEVIQALLLGIKDDNERGILREASARALGKLGGANNPEVIQALLQVMKDKEEYVRNSAAIALGNLGITNHPAVIQALLQAMKDEGASVSNSAAEALGKLLTPNSQYLEILFFKDVSVNNERIADHTAQLPSAAQSITDGSRFFASHAQNVSLTTLAHIIVSQFGVAPKTSTTAAHGLFAPAARSDDNDEIINICRTYKVDQDKPKLMHVIANKIPAGALKELLTQHGIQFHDDGKIHMHSFHAMQI